MMNQIQAEMKNEQEISRKCQSSGEILKTLNRKWAKKTREDFITRYVHARPAA